MQFIRSKAEFQSEINKKRMDTKDNNKKEINNGFFIRRAIEDDINVLTSLSRISFPDQLIWCSKSQAEKTWKRFINSDFQEVWVCQLDDEVVAVIRFEKDVPQCNKETRPVSSSLLFDNAPRDSVC